MNNKPNFTRINKQIKISPVVVISPEGNNLGTFPLDRALQLSFSAELDLVEINPNSRPPICKIMDFGKFKYEQKIKEKEKKASAKKNQTKEVHMKSRIDSHDLQTKINSIIKFLKEGHRVFVKVMFMGRDAAHKELGFDIEEKIKTACINIGVAEPRKMQAKYFSFNISPEKN